MHPARQTLEELRRETTFETARGSGPGGQHRNKTDTAVRVVHRPTGIHTLAGERRSLQMNQRRALQRLRLKLALEFRQPLEEDTFAPPGVYEPSELWEARRQGTRMVVSVQHEDFPALLAEALDVLEHYEEDLPRTARLLNLTTAQLLRFLRREPVALARLNERRKSKGLKPYH